MNYRTIVSYIFVAGVFIFLVSAYLYYNEGLDNSQNTFILPDKNNAILSKTDIEEIVKKTISSNPELIIDTVENYYKAKIDKDKVATQEKITTLNDEIFNNLRSPRTGNDNPKVQMVVFIDYSSIFCKKILPVLNRLLEQNNDLEIIFKEIPILGKNSNIATQAALAINIIDSSKYLDFNNNLLKYQGNINEEVIFDIASNLDIDIKKLKSTMNDNLIEDMIQENLKLAANLRISATPAYIIGNQLLFGVLSHEDAKNMLDDIRASKYSNRTSVISK